MLLSKIITMFKLHNFKFSLGSLCFGNSTALEKGRVSNKKCDLMYISMYFKF